MNNDNNIRQILIIGIFFQIILAITIFSSFGVVTFYFLVLPFIIFTYLSDNKKTIGFTIINMLIATLIGKYIGIYLTFFAATIGITMGILYKKYKTAITAFVGGVIATIINLIILLFVSSYLFQFSITNFINDFIDTSIKYTDELLNSFNSEEQVQWITDSYHAFFDMFDLLVPFMVIFISILLISINHFAFGRIMARFNVDTPKFSKIKNWVFPKSIIFYYLIVMLIMLIEPLNDIYYLNLAALNLYPLLQIVLILQGISFIFYYVENKKWGKTIKIITIISLFIPALIQIIQMIGLIDLGFNLRKRFKG